MAQNSYHMKINNKNLFILILTFKIELATKKTQIKRVESCNTHFNVFLLT